MALFLSCVKTFTSANFDGQGEKEELDKLIPADQEKYSTFIDKHYTVKGFKLLPPEILFSDLNSVNEIIYYQNK